MTIDLSTMPDLNMFEHIRSMPKPARVLCRSEGEETCPATEKILVLGSISDADVKTVLSLVEKGRTRVSQITGDARVAELHAPMLNLGRQNFLCYTVREEWRCVSTAYGVLATTMQEAAATATV